MTSAETVLSVEPLGSPWVTADPFLFCVHHDDAYPAGNDELGPAASLAGRQLGRDFAGADGWRMYHGLRVPGFPHHPHRGFETVTVVRRGVIDHADSLGAAARYGAGDVQWLTAGAGVVHSEMFPLLERERANPLELFQIWLNLPRAEKMAPPHFDMLWRGDVPVHRLADDAGRATDVTVVAGRFAEAPPPPAPPPHSWAARPDSHVAIWTVRMDPAARATLPPAPAGASRSLYVFSGPGARIGEREVATNTRVQVAPGREVAIEAGPGETELLVLQGRPIGEPVVQYGPFVMTSPAEIQQALRDYDRTGFGGWPWPSDAPVHPRGAGRFARRPGQDADERPAE